MPMNWPNCSTRRTEVPRRPGRRAWPASLGLVLALSGCGSNVDSHLSDGSDHVSGSVSGSESGNENGGLSTILYMYVGLREDQRNRADDQRAISLAFHRIEQDFRRINPGVRFVLQFYPERDLENELSRRNGSGLGPDLLLVSNSTALRLALGGLTRAVVLPPDVLKQVSPTTLRRMKLANGQLTALPVMQQAQLACFNAAKLRRPPTTMQELLKVSSANIRVGLSIDSTGLYWTAGSLGATEGMVQAAAKRPLSPEQRAGIVRWATWLQNAANQQRITFFSNQQQLLEELIAGRLDWITCRSMDLQRLRRSLGPHLGVSALPDGPRDEASPINQLLVIAFGQNSSPQQRRAAEAFAHFSLNPLVQRNITLGSQEVLPVNRFVDVPQEGSQQLKAMLHSQAQSRQAEQITLLIHLKDPRIAAVQTKLTELVFGESTPIKTANGVIEVLEGKR